MIRAYSQIEQAQAWLERYRHQAPIFACILGFTETGLIPGISAAGATPTDRQYTALADAEFLYAGVQQNPKYRLPPLQAGASPVFITRAIVAAQNISVYLFNAGLPHPPSVPHIDLGGVPARCVSSGKAMALSVVQQLWEAGLQWGEKLAMQMPQGYVILSECVVGGTTTALAVLTGLGWDAIGKVNSSHPICNHQQKWQVVSRGLEQCGFVLNAEAQTARPIAFIDPFQLIAAVGDPMQIVVAGMAMAASRTCGVLLAGGTQMLAVYALMRAIGQHHPLTWHPEQIVVGTTRWVAEDPTGDTVGLAQTMQVPLLGTQLSFVSSQYPAFRAYEQGYVKEGVGAGGCAIAAHLYWDWKQTQLLEVIEILAKEYQQNQ